MLWCRSPGEMREQIHVVLVRFRDAGGGLRLIVGLVGDRVCLDLVGQGCGAALPNLRTALLSATVLTVALVLGEFTMASLDLYQTFPVWIVAFDQTSGPVSTAASLLALFVTWLFLLLIVTVGGRRARRTGGAQVDLISVTRRDTVR